MARQQKWRQRFLTAGLAMAAGVSGACFDPSLFGPGQTATTATVTIDSSGFHPWLALIQPGGTLTFENQDGVSRRTVSDVCNELNSPVIAAGSKVSIQMPAAKKMCTYHDEATPSFTGTVQVCSEIASILGPCR